MKTKRLNSAKAEKPAKTTEEQNVVRPSKVDAIFQLVKNKDGVKIVMGNYLISRRTFKSWQAAEDYLHQKPYEIIVNVACLCAEKTIQTIKNDEKVK